VLQCLLRCDAVSSTDSQSNDVIALKLPTEHNYEAVFFGNSPVVHFLSMWCLCTMTLFASVCALLIYQQHYTMFCIVFLVCFFLCATASQSNDKCQPCKWRGKNVILYPFNSNYPSSFPYSRIFLFLINAWMHPS